MWKIIESIFLSALGMLFIYKGQRTSTYVDNTNLALLFLGGILLPAAFIILLYGLRDLFIRDILAELRSITSRIPPLDPAPPSKPKNYFSVTETK